MDCGLPHNPLPYENDRKTLAPAVSGFSLVENQQFYRLYDVRLWKKLLFPTTTCLPARKKSTVAIRKVISTSAHRQKCGKPLDPHRRRILAGGFPWTHDPL